MSLFRECVELLRDLSGAPPEPHREILVGSRHENYSRNLVITSKYHVWDFLPRNLFEQFQRLANFYFLIIAVIQAIPGVSPINPWLSMMPLIFVLGVSAMKEAREDYFRHKQDDEINNRSVKLFDPSTKAFIKTTWQDLHVGDIVKIYDREFFPADLVMVKSSVEENTCYIETANLDGETNLKIKQAPIDTAKLITQLSDLYVLENTVIKCENPNNQLYKFEGNLTVPNTATLSLDNSQILLRGCQLRNTDWIVGIVIFAGHDTKLMRNSSKSKFKTSTIERNLNAYILSVFGVLVALATLSGILGGVFVNDAKEDAWYLNFSSSENATAYGGMGILTYMILYNTLIPISLYVSIEMVKVVQAVLINSDESMYYADTDTPAKARTSNLSDELGEIQYIFSDKTGTLTRNIMEFKKCSIGGVTYGSLDTASSAVYDFGDDRLEAEMKKETEQGHRIRDFMLLMSICHTVIPEASKDQEVTNIDDLVYQASSPDEGALVNAARHFKYKFKSRSPTTVTVNALGKDEVWHILNVIEFNSNRKRMSVLAQSPDGEIVLFCKGADSIMFPRFQAGQDHEIMEIKRHLDEFGADGLRTLCLGKKVIPHETYHEWNKEYTEASIALVDREEKMELVAEKIEQDLRLVGATAIEDKLQDGVPDCIATLREAGLKIWVLTGDKQETAINIGFSCRLIAREMSLVIINAPNAEKTRELLNQIYDAEVSRQEPMEIALVIDGATLNYALHECQEEFLKLAKISKSVICCRVSPSQKARVVKLMKTHMSAITLSIGDGANDVSMIKEAHIGVGISGQEGMQAVMASDYAIAQFRFLLPLLLVHGRWSYLRISQIVRYSFYKNICFTLSSLWFSMYTGFSGQTLLDSFYIAVFNVFFTSLPIMGLAVFDRDVSKRDLEMHPQLFSYRQATDRFDMRSFWIWIFDGFIHSLICFFFPFLVFYNTTSTFSDGLSGGDGLWALGTTSYTCIILTVNLKIAFMTNTWTGWNWFFTVGSVAIWFIFVAIYHSINVVALAELYGVFSALASMPAFWLTIFAAPILGCMVDFALSSGQKWLHPTSTDIVRERASLRRRQKHQLLAMSPTV
eukprot:TRINITY_DN3306_c0_g2_i2.p1 TRINITY_DN3306_c0_g2~~TRINITY_DN3306_c0_g2_i2.p1  ORF type:complete len:1090 (-),score=226.20 TRINITY_DN3306_c0_g2_i2:575-3844(-)